MHPCYWIKAALFLRNVFISNVFIDWLISIKRERESIHQILRNSMTREWKDGSCLNGGANVCFVGNVWDGITITSVDTDWLILFARSSATYNQQYFIPQYPRLSLRFDISFGQFVLQCVHRKVCLNNQSRIRSQYFLILNGQTVKLFEAFLMILDRKILTNSCLLSFAFITWVINECHFACFSGCNGSEHKGKW